MPFVGFNARSVTQTTCRMIAIRLYQNWNKKKADGKAPIYYVLASGKDSKYIGAKRYLRPEHFVNITGLVLKGADNYIKTQYIFQTRNDKVIYFVNY